MALHIVRFQHDEAIGWGILENNNVYPLNIPCSTTKALLDIDREKMKAAIGKEALTLSSINLLSPITSPSKILCQGANYRQHMIDSGMDPDVKKFNMFFTKSTASINNPTGVIIKPWHVSLLDYEIELTLVLGKQTQGPLEITEHNLHEYVAGICIGNDVSARDIQIPQMQFHKGKSYRTFCPLGPVLCLLDKSEMHYLNSLQLKLTVNGNIRQQDSTANLVFKPAESLSEFSQIHDFEPGDVVMTGTPSGCALKLPPPLIIRLLGLLPESKRWQLFIKSQKRREEYLKPSDYLEATIASLDGVINLGQQFHVIKDE
ncbi:fumarylacetoacetate hydrolase family protein [Shewanella profunda]|uniref:fumarylacetoacetate hydrolase family protein n=1 Tax=Shewanella profunda TaxID=254793 RepID=UPI00200D8ECE|nr:fumarylacetoacetate hydrolase family protein [Shewanella profunda]MCL1089118.1 fumarylacetoacetate hydrolase family protein [Shewanella profunda]